MAPLIDQACSLTGRTYRPGDYDDRDSFAVRVLAEHARSATMLVGDGVFPSNEARGFVLRRIIRRAVRYAYLLGTEQLVMPTLAEVAVDVMGNAYPDVARQRDFIVGVLGKEEERFRQTLRNGLTILEGELAGGADELSGSTAFVLHDTYGFPLELTQEIAGERDVTVDVAGFETEMAEQRAAGQGGPAHGRRRRQPRRLPRGRRAVRHDDVRRLHRRRRRRRASSPCVPVPAATTTSSRSSSTARRSTPRAAARSATAARSRTETGHGRGARHDVRPAQPAPPHRPASPSGTITAGQLATAAIDVARRDATRRNHTATHLLHHALREVLGDHVKQAGSLVAPDRLRFDFSHYEPVTRRADRARSSASPTRRRSPTPACGRSRRRKAEAEELGAIAFFGDKYGDIVRVLEAGPSIELCGGTHVRATGDIGTIKVVSEGSIGSNLRRIEAVTGEASVALLQRDERVLADAARLVGAPADDLVGGVQRKLDELRALGDEVKALRAKLATGRAGELAATAVDGVVVQRVDGLGARRPARPRPRRAQRAGRRRRRARRRDVDRRRQPRRRRAAGDRASRRRALITRRRQGGRRWRRRQGRRRHGRRQGPGRHRRGPAHRRRRGRRRPRLTCAPSGSTSARSASASPSATAPARSPRR